MKITKERLLQIIREEVELHEKNLEENILELDEEILEEISKEEKTKNKEIIDQAIEDTEGQPSDSELEEKKDKRVIKKGKYKTTPSLAAAAKGKVHKMTAVAKQAKKAGLKNPYGAAQATKKATDNFKKTEEDKLFDPKTKKPINKTK